MHWNFPAGNFRMHRFLLPFFSVLSARSLIFSSIDSALCARVSGTSKTAAFASASRTAVATVPSLSAGFNTCLNSFDYSPFSELGFCPARSYSTVSGTMAEGQDIKSGQLQAPDQAQSQERHPAASSDQSESQAHIPNDENNLRKDSDNNEDSHTKPLLALPSSEEGSGAESLDVSSEQGLRLDHLGPMVINKDGTLSRISNWDKMSEIEKQNTLRVLGKRNQLRRAALEKSAKEAERASE